MHESGRVWCVKNGEDLEPFIMWMMSAGHKVDVGGKGAATNNTLDVRAPLLIRTLDVKRLVLNFVLRLGACNLNVCPSPHVHLASTHTMNDHKPSFFDFGCLLAHCSLERQEKPSYHMIGSIASFPGAWKVRGSAWYTLFAHAWLPRFSWGIWKLP